MYDTPRVWTHLRMVTSAQGSRGQCFRFGYLELKKKWQLRNRNTKIWVGCRLGISETSQDMQLINAPIYG
ncbi:hypothetical protein CEXT_128541 [Caerostris extrusa]|uniref:Ycf15 n=1 Tax=Caerostris extrusa TaxID=172846 RepID=A0AAV4XI96_CAEEX|nr:hypothetical protein CEXT_128541 [Caerostris extrusa]